MKSQSTLKIELTSDNYCRIESNIEDNVIQEDNLSSRIINQPQNIIPASSNIISDSYINNSDLLSISKTDSNISVFSAFQQKEKDKDSTSNLFISFSNISEADPRHNGDSSINLNVSSNSIVCKREQSQIQKCSSLTPSTICNYYLHSNDVTPNKPVDPNIFNHSIKKTNLNLIYSSMNNNNAEEKEGNLLQGKEGTSSKKNIFNFQQEKRTPIKYTKSQLKHNESDSDIEGGKKNLMLLFNEGEDLSNNNIDFSQPGDFFSQSRMKENNNNNTQTIEIQSHVQQVEHINAPRKNIQIEKINNFMIPNVIANNHQKGISFPLSPNNYSNFSFDITRNNNFLKSSKQQEDLNMNCNEEKRDMQTVVKCITNQVINIKKEVPFKQNIDPNSNVSNHLNWASNNSYVSPKFMNGPQLSANDSTAKASTLASTNSEKKNQKTIESNNSPDSASNRIHGKDHNKYVSNFTLPTHPKNKSPQLVKGNNIISTKRTDSVINLDQQKHLKSHSISPRTNTPKNPNCTTKAVKRNLSFLRHYNTTIRTRPNSASKSRSKDKQNTSNNSNKNDTPKSSRKPKYINKTQLNLEVKSNSRPKQSQQGAPVVSSLAPKNEPLTINIIQKIKEKTSSNLINFINTLKPSCVLKDTLIKARKSPSPTQIQAPIKTRTAHINLSNLLNKNIVDYKKSQNQPNCIIQSALQKVEENQSLNSTKLINNSRLSTNGKESLSNTVISTQKKQAKVIQNFSNYKKKTSYEKHFVSKKAEEPHHPSNNFVSNQLKPIISNKYQRPGGDDNLNILIEDF